jgi:NitT/TauT family transport system permease protein
MGDAPTMKATAANRVRRTIEFVLPFLVVATLWELAVQSGLIGLESLPAPSTVLQKLWKLGWETGALWRHLFRSLYRLTIGYLLATGLGIAVGTLLAMRRTMREMFSPILSLLISVPTIAWVPVLLITTGLGDRTVISAVFLGGFFAIAYNTMRGIEMVSESQINAARITGVRRLRLFASVLLPGSLVSVITGLRLGIGYSWRALVGGEMLSALVEWGIGKMVYQARFWNDVAAMFVGLIVIALSGLLLDRMLLKWLEKETVEKWGMLAER